jgi:hypothetical protein
MTQMILTATNKYTGKCYSLKLASMPKNDSACAVVNAFTSELLRYKESGNVDTEATGQLVDFMQSLGCFGGHSETWEITDKDGNLLIFGNNDAHSWVKPSIIKKRNWIAFLKGMFEKEVKKEVKPMATKLTKKRGEKK